MSGSRRALHTSLLLLLGATALAGGTLLAVIMAVAILRMGVRALLALLSWVPMFGSAAPRDAVPQYDFLSPTLALLGGVLLFSIGWVVVLRGVTAAWPTRFNHAGAEPIPLSDQAGLVARGEAIGGEEAERLEAELRDGTVTDGPARQDAVGDETGGVPVAR